jgi:alpha-galactosidase
MPVIFHEESGEFHLYNDEISYIIEILPNAQLGQLYYGKKLEDRNSYAYMREEKLRPLAAYVAEKSSLSLQYTRQEYPSYGTTDFRYPAVTVLQENGSRITNFTYESHWIFNGKRRLEGLPAVYTEREDEAVSLEITLHDPVIGTKLVLSYTIYSDLPVIARNARFIKDRGSPVVLERAMSTSIDLSDADYEMIRLSGAWARERYIKTGKLEQGVQSVYSMRGASSAEHNPFLALKRPDTTEFSGEIYGFSFVYSGSFLAQVEVDTHDTARIMLGIHPDVFEWELREGESFQTPEAVMVYSRQGLNGMSQVYHLLYRTRLARGYWRDRRRPVLLNNWESTEFDFDEEKILKIASMGQSLGVELFVLDDGWFGERNNDRAGLGDWVANRKKLPDGIEGLADKIRRMGMQFGLWIEPEMVNKDSDLYREHPDWILSTPERISSPCRHQYTLDLTRSEVREYLYGKIAEIIRDARISYIKWDMNRYMTECFSSGTENRRQGEVMHRYILGLYSLYDRLIREFPHLLFESCSSGGARFDPGMLYYAPQAWTSDDTDAIERLKIQYGSSYVYPVSCMGAHVSAVPNAQVGRMTPLSTRFEVACYGAFGYELDLNRLSAEEKEEVRQQIVFVKQYGELLQQGVFYRLLSPFGQSYASWMCINGERTAALVSCYRILNGVNEGFRVLKLKGLDEQRIYTVSFFSGGCERIGTYSGSELMYAGIGMTGLFRGKTGDFQSVTLLIEE